MTDPVQSIDGLAFWHEVVGENVDHRLLSDDQHAAEYVASPDGTVFTILTLPLPCLPRSALRPDLQLAALLTYCSRHLSNPDLSPQAVAAHFGISVRTLHLRFAQLGRTFGRWVLGQRLDACRIALRDPGQRGAGIAEIAYRCGFNDLSHFYKVFRTRFGTTPREWRNGG
jgi:AraC-like DNA-binding protein